MARTCLNLMPALDRVPVMVFNIVQNSKISLTAALNCRNPSFHSGAFSCSVLQAAASRSLIVLIAPVTEIGVSLSVIGIVS